MTGKKRPYWGILFAALAVLAVFAGLGACKNPWISAIAGEEEKGGSPSGSPPTAAVPVLTGTVTINGSPEVGQTLTVNTAGLNGSGTISFQWKRDGADISGETNASYTLVSGDIGTVISVTVTRAGNSGSVSASAGTIGLPVLTGTVTITVGQTLTVNTVGLDGSGTISFQWKQGTESSGPFTDIGGATNTAYAPAADDLGKYIAVTVTRTGYTGSVTSSGVNIPFNAASLLGLINAAPSGETVTLPAGDYDMASEISVTKVVTITTAPGATVTLNRSDSYTGNFFSVTRPGKLTLDTGGSGAELILDGNKGNVSAAGSLIVVNPASEQPGELVIKSGVTLRNNASSYGAGGAVTVNPICTFTMEAGAAISGNRTASHGGGVYINDSVFTMVGGTISGNTAAYNGGGVFIDGVNHDRGIFNMYGGIIENNSAGSKGGGVYLGGASGSGKFYMWGGNIYGLDAALPNIPNTAGTEGAAFFREINKPAKYGGEYGTNILPDSATYTDSTIGYP